MAYEITKMLYSHEALADVMLAQPKLSNRELAYIFDKTPTWVSYVKNSGAFQTFLHEKKDRLVDPVLIQTVEDRLQGMAAQSMDILMDKLNSATVSDELALECLKTSTKALGYGAKGFGIQVNNNNYVVALPQKIDDAKEWATKYKGGGLEAGGGQIVGAEVEKI